MEANTVDLKALVEISRHYGRDPEFVLEGGGNTSFKTEQQLYIKASGVALGDIDESGFVGLDRRKLRRMWDTQYPTAWEQREAEVLRDLLASRQDETPEKRPSVETLLHDLMPQRYVVHTHPALINGLTCARKGAREASALLGPEMLWIPSVRPGYTLARTVKDSLEGYLRQRGVHPQVLLLQNHGLVVAADTAKAVHQLTQKAVAQVKSRISREPDFSPAPVDKERAALIAPVLRMLLLEGREGSICRFRNNRELSRLISNRQAFKPVSSAFTPDHIVYAGPEPLYLTHHQDLEDQYRVLRRELEAYRQRYGSGPRIIAVQGLGLFAWGTSRKEATSALNLFLDAAKVAAYAEDFGGPCFLTPELIDFIVRWEAEAYRKKQGGVGTASAGRGSMAGGPGEIGAEAADTASAGRGNVAGAQGEIGAEAAYTASAVRGSVVGAPGRIGSGGVGTALTAPGRRLAGKIALVTGGAQGFGAGIAEGLLQEGCHLAIADLNLAGAQEQARRLGRRYGGEKALALEADISEEDSTAGMMRQVTLEFGGLDLLVSNAGVLRAGDLSTMDGRSFDLVTRVNYTGYFLCSKYAAAIMKLQHRFKEDHTMDIVQINSKSGLAGSNRNFAYAGSKFGGIGLTQSFALELVEHNIKVNAICPGNFFDGPLWSDPERGLFFQYLKAGKVPGAKTVADVRRFYEAKVPMKRGCRLPDLLRALIYVIEQAYETGQAVPVTGGQVMLG